MAAADPTGPDRIAPAVATPGDEEAVLARIGLAMAQASGSPPPGSIWIGDDAAVVRAPAGMLAFATDAVVAGIHADLSLVGLDDLGWKAMAATLSDLGAMGARPLHALVTACLPPGTDADLLTAGIAAASAHWSCPVVGGDLTGADQVMVSVAATGTFDEVAGGGGGAGGGRGAGAGAGRGAGRGAGAGNGSRGPAVTRSGASPGDRLLVTGPLGSSAAGLRLLRRAAAGADAGAGPVSRGPGGGGPGGGGPGGGGIDLVSAPAMALMAAHRRPLARLDEGVVARLAGATAMIDVSDGLSIDLHRLADASSVGFRLDRVPVAEGATDDEALAGGEDYELVIAIADVVRLQRALAAAGLRPGIVVGACTADPAERLLAGRPLARRGWVHQLG